MELDDLDIDFARSVVVVEWGAGLLDGVAESWLELDIVRPTGAGGRPGGPVDDAAPATTTRTPMPDPTDESVGADEPRTVTIRGFGPRWAGTPYAEDSGAAK